MIMGNESEAMGDEASDTQTAERYDVVVVGGGNAALCAALSARESGASVAVFERAQEEEKGGNSSFTAGAWRVVYNGEADIRKIMPELSDGEMAGYDFGTYTEDAYFDDMGKMTQYHTDPDLCELLVKHSTDAVIWLRSKGVRFLPYRRQSAPANGKLKWFGGLTIEAVGGGLGLVEAEHKAAANAGVRIFYNARVVSLQRDDAGVHGVTVVRDGKTVRIGAGAVVLAAGGFESNVEWRARYLGPGWDLAKVRGTRYNTGDGIRMALDIGAQPTGNWTGCHAVSWERNAPAFGDRTIGELYSKHSYPFGIMVNADGKRFLDEGADFFTYTYAKYGHRVLQQPGQFAWQIFDSQVSHLLREDYKIRQITRVRADTIEGLVKQLDDVNQEALLQTIRDYNASIKRDVAFNPTIKDGRSTTGLAVAKSNWATALEQPPFEAYGVTCGVTFTFGGIKINREAQVIDIEDRPIPGLYAAGEMVGGIFYFNYPGGAGLTNGAVFGRIGGRNAAHAASVAAASRV